MAAIRSRPRSPLRNIEILEAEKLAERAAEMGAYLHRRAAQA